MDIIDRTIQREGGFVDHPSDPGGATNMGITQVTLSRYLGCPATRAEVVALTHETARDVYQKEYMDAPQFDRIEDMWLREVAFDAGFLFGPARASMFLQEAAGVAADGRIGPVTLGAVNEQDPRDLGRRIIASWLRRHGDRVQSGRSSYQFIGGWIRRATAHLLDMPL